ncbi:hypothetical protein M406DRAFT_345302 [Cryphonectria parasitica EP155]|uniref:Uncharacterized protein n=1 Tax=Cryphonectria parasitica (strain ATCC 38755 / EP155) TaxID=660469 RepID=A0A9P4Y673_CRYP1|nr:uncharacterized protein M406DRAFT_345302 [Cryphonectria parasitica EP155]KAF3767112.1 hypothetical protein M406DRAFT_345302 [Cryphonectria parasitica EP155]
MEIDLPELSLIDESKVVSQDYKLAACNANVTTRSDKTMARDDQNASRPGIPGAQHMNQSVDSLVSRKSSTASQVSWGGNDEFDQVLEAIGQDIEQHLALLKPSPLSRLVRLGSSKSSSQRDLKHRARKELRALQDTLRENLGRSDVRRMQRYDDEVSPPYRLNRGVCYRRLLQFRDEVQELLQSLQPSTAVRDLKLAQVAQMSQELSELPGIA